MSTQQSQSTRPLLASEQVWEQALNTFPSNRRKQYKKAEERQIFGRVTESTLLSSQPRCRGPGREE